MKLKKILCVAVSAALAIGALTACGKKASDPEAAKETSGLSSTAVNPDATPYVTDEVASEFMAKGTNITSNPDGGVTVAVEAREGEKRHEFETEDLGFVDTKSGALLKIGMSIDEIESIIGQPRELDGSYRTYDGIVIEYNDNSKAIKLILSNGNMRETDSPTRYVSPRGIKLTSSLDEFKSVYGDEYIDGSETAQEQSAMNGSTRAIRYYAQDGDKYSYIGVSTSKDTTPENDSDLIMQMFLFEPGTNTVSAMTVQTGESRP